MTTRAIILGLACVCFIAFATYFNDFILKGTFLIGSYMPIPVYGGLILFLLLVNPVLRRLRAGWALTAPELAVIVALVLAAACVPGRGLMHHFPNLLMLPHHYVRTDQSWKSEDVVSLAPKRMLADPSRNESEALDGYVQGMGVGSRHMSPGKIPWYAWTRTIRFWIPLILALSLCLTGMALVVHRQWSDHEQLPYPIITFARSLLPEEGRAKGAIFANRVFWVGAVAVLIYHANNYAYQWWPKHMVEMPRQLGFQSLVQLWPTLWSGPGTWRLFNPTIVITVIAFAYFLPSDVSLSLGIAPYVYMIFGTICATYGIVLGGGFITQRTDAFIYGGAYFGVFLALLYTGRHYYISVLRRSLWLRSRDEVERSAVWGGRVFFLGGFLFVACLVAVGLDWQLAVIYTALTVMLCTVVSRIVAEAGMFFIHPWFFPCVLMLGFFGERALGPASLMIMFMVTSAVLVDPREIFMPFIVHAFKLTDSVRVRLGPTAAWGMVALVLVLAVALPVTLYWQYDQGSGQVGDGWTRGVPKFAFDGVVRTKQKIEAQGGLDEVNALAGWRRFAAVKPSGPCMIAFSTTLGLVLLFTFCRLRFPRWPLHPVLFCVLGTWQAQSFGPSFLIGWLIKVAVNRYGGASVYQKLRPLMIGLIAGEMTAGVITMIISLIYYLATGDPPKQYQILAG